MEYLKARLHDKDILKMFFLDVLSIDDNVVKIIPVERMKKTYSAARPVVCEVNLLKKKRNRLCHMTKYRPIYTNIKFHDDKILI